MYLSCQHGISQSKHAILGHIHLFFLSPRIYHWLKILTTGICLIFYWLLMTGTFHVAPGNPKELFGVSNFKKFTGKKKIPTYILFQFEYFGYQQLVKSKNLSHVTFLLCIAVLFWVMDRQVRSEIRQQYYMFFVSLFTTTLSWSFLQHEYLRRLDYQWKRQLKSEQFQASITKLVNRALLQNILPMHVGNENLLNSPLLSLR